MMMLRAKVRRAQRAAYVSNLLRRKSQGQQGGDGTQTADDDAKLDEEQLLAQADDVQLTAQVRLLSTQRPAADKGVILCGSWVDALLMGKITAVQHHQCAQCPMP